MKLKESLASGQHEIANKQQDHIVTPTQNSGSGHHPPLHSSVQNDLKLGLGGMGGVSGNLGMMSPMNEKNNQDILKAVSKVNSFYN